jgi:hypothetical protein
MRPASVPTIVAWLACVLVAPLASPAARAEDPPKDERPYTVRLADLERRVEELKERIRVRRPRRYHAFPVTLTIHRRVPASYRLARVRIVHGADVVYEGAPALAEGPVRFEWLANVLPERAVKVTLTFRGEDTVFTYLRGYELTLDATREAAPSDLELVVFDRGGVTTPFAERVTATWSR